MSEDPPRLPTLEALERELVERAERVESTRLTLRPLALIAVVLLVLAMSLTPFGRAAAENLGELIGIGDEPSRERASSTEEPAVVIGVGRSPDGEVFEIVASTAFANSLGSATCLSLDFPSSAGTVAAGCLSDALLESLERRGIVASATVQAAPPLADRVLITGIVGPNVERVLIEDRAGGKRFTGTATLAQLRPALAEQIGAEEATSFFVGVPPAGMSTGRGDRSPTPNFLVTALSETGKTVARHTLRSVAATPPVD